MKSPANPMRGFVRKCALSLIAIMACAAMPLGAFASLPQAAPVVAVHRFYQSSANVHFYTASEEEYQYVKNYLRSYADEGIAYYAYSQPYNGAVAVYRFFVPNTGEHFYTTSVAERDIIRNQMQATHIYEGIAYYAFDSANSSYAPSAIYRFYNYRNGVHFFTASANEADIVRRTLANTYNYEGVAIYGYPSASYASCTEARNAGAAPIYRGQPGYSSTLDRDNDGVACETSSATASSGSAQTIASYATATVTNVVDGDTVDVNAGGLSARVRLIGVDTPETVDPDKPVQCYGRKASNYSKAALTNSTVTLQADASQGDTDRYGRLLRYVFLADGTNFNRSLISNGYAHEYTYSTAYAYQADFRSAESQARAGLRGFWSPATCNGDTTAAA